MSKKGWVSLELWDNTMEECVLRWFQNKWSLSKEHKSNVEDILFYGLAERVEGNLEIYTFTDGYIFLKLKDVDKLPPISKIHGAQDWVKVGSREENSPVTVFSESDIEGMRNFINLKIEDIMNSLKEGSLVKVCKGIHKGMTGMVDKKEGIYVHLSFYLNSKTFEAKVPFWFLEIEE